MLGASDPSEIIGRDVLDFVHPDFKEIVRERIRQTQKGRQAVPPLVEKLVGVDGRTIEVEIQAIPITYQGRSATQIVGLEVSSRVETEEALRESEERYRQLFNSITDICYVIDREWRYTHANLAASRVTAKDESDLIGQRIMDVFPDIEGTLQFRAYKQVMETGRPRQFTTNFLLPEGLPGVFEVRVYPVPEGIMCIAHDITDRIKAEEALRESREHFRMLFESVPQAVLIHTGEEVLAVNHAFEVMFGYTQAEATGLSPLELIADESRPLVEEHAEGGLSQPREFMARRKDGSTFPAQAYANQIVYKGQTAHIVAIGDLTSIKEAQTAERAQRVLAEALRDTAAVLNSTLSLDEVLDRILEHLDRVIPHDAASVLLLCSDMAQVARYHTRGDRLEPEGILDVRFPLAETPDLRRMMETQQPLVIPDVREFANWIVVPGMEWVRSSVGAPIIRNDEVIGFLSVVSATPGFFQDEHAEHLQAFANQAAIAIKNAELYEAVQRHAHELEGRNNELDAFTYMVAHDLKSPLQIIVGFANVLRSEFSDEMSKNVLEGLEHIETYALKMNEMIEELLLLARLRHAEETIEEVPVAPLVEEVLARFQTQIEERGIEVEVDADLPPALAHRPWLEAVFANLIENAIKYIGDENPEPRIAIRGRLIGDDLARYEVIDNGMGIALQDQGRVFEMFTRFHTTEGKGSGLGLAIVKRIITKLNGEIGVESMPEEGSTFWFTLPVPPQEG